MYTSDDVYQYSTLIAIVCKGYKPQTLHSVRERTDRGPKGREQFLSLNECTV